MRFEALELRRRLLNEAVGREVHADELAELAVQDPAAIHEPTLRVLAHSQRIRAMELRGQAAALAALYGYGESDAIRSRSGRKRPPDKGRPVKGGNARKGCTG